ncbi:AcetylCholine Receptor [Caenorhabditis elegans]|uniref:AcetylCholine Receptor n=1 Tax=Caenorhabditis elegans TaxID=6239 RepID=P91197_CAEEL|nr:AcetylCholine Receptor [Caenorhabditis elegans]CCD68494.1 AcetylCholine Receptor [Caenorhabditis elegans]|eukprot:NP_491906.1 AcetylCholine Receptor [Caenorhabditis elegans]
MIFNLINSILSLVIIHSNLCDGSVAETKLFTDLLKGYNPLERPVQNSSQPLEVKIKLFLQQILDVDEKNQIVSVNAWLSYTWFDHKLQWEPKKYGGIQDIRFPGSSDHIWKPDVLLYNSAAEDFDSTFKSNLLTYHTGTVVWIPPGVLKFVCQLDVTWFPFDDQVCEMKFGSWTFHGYAIDLQIDDDTNGTQSMDLSTYLVNGEWQVISTNAKRVVSYYKCCPEPYPTVNYYLHIRRRTLYYGFNLIIPSLLISLMAILGFMFPPDAGEKITLEVTILLAIVFFLSMVSEMTPPTSEAVPLIGVFFSCCMLVVSASVVFTIVVLNLHFRSADSHEMNPLVRRVLLEFLPWLLFMSRPGYKFVKANVIDSTDKMPKKPKNPLDCNLPSNHAGYEAQILLLHSVHTELRRVVAFYNKEEHDERIQTDWRFAAMVVDRACLLLFTVFIVISILAIMMSAPHIIA